MAQPAIRTEGIKELRKDLKALGKAEPKELTKALKAAGELVLPAARALAPRQSGRLAASLRASGASNRVSIRSKLPYANAVHWGGTVGRQKTSYIKASHFVLRAVDTKTDEIVNTIGDSIEELARRHGWH